MGTIRTVRMSRPVLLVLANIQNRSVARLLQINKCHGLLLHDSMQIFKIALLPDYVKVLWTRATFWRPYCFEIAIFNK